VTHAFLARRTAPPEPAPQVTIRVLSLESMDGTKRIQLNGSTGWWRMAGSTGLEMPPFEVALGSAPGVAGAVLQGVRVRERDVFVPMFTASKTGPVNHLAMLEQVRGLVDPMVGQFRLVGVTPTSVRELVVIYREGLEGADGRSESGTYWRKFGLKATALDPYARDLTDRSVESARASGGRPVIGVVGGSDAPFPFALSGATVIGSNMQVNVNSSVPVFPVLELVGPMDSFTGSMDTGWSVSVPGGLADGETMRLVTDPRSKSIRVNGQLAAGRVARGSVLKPFVPGVNVLNVTAPGATTSTLLRLSWRAGHRSLW